jgi:hypothetical protein
MKVSVIKALGVALTILSTGCETTTALFNTNVGVRREVNAGITQAFMAGDAVIVTCVIENTREAEDRCLRSLRADTVKNPEGTGYRPPSLHIDINGALEPVYLTRTRVLPSPVTVAPTGYTAVPVLPGLGAAPSSAALLGEHDLVVVEKSRDSSTFLIIRRATEPPQPDIFQGECPLASRETWWRTPMLIAATPGAVLIDIARTPEYLGDLIVRGIYIVALVVAYSGSHGP